MAKKCLHWHYFNINKPVAQSSKNYKKINLVEKNDELKDEIDLTKESEKKSFASLFTDNRKPGKGLPLNFIPSDQSNAAVFNEMEWREGVDYWKNALIGHVIGFNAKFKSMEAYVNKAWGRISIPKIILIKSGVFLFDFPSEQQMRKVLDAGPWFFGSRPLSATGISKISSLIGCPITTDMLTATRQRLSYARVLLEVKLPLKEPLPDIVEIQGPDGKKYRQNVIYELKPKWCTVCNIVGHDTEYCRRQKGRKMWVPVNKQKEVVQAHKVQTDTHSAQEQVDRLNTNTGKENDVQKVLPDNESAYEAQGKDSMSKEGCNTSQQLTENMHSLKDKGKAVGSPGAQGIKHGSPCLTNVYQSPTVNASGFTSVSRAHIARRTTINIDGNSNQKTQFSPLDPQYNIPFIALLETKLKEEKMEHIARKFARDWNWISNVQEAGNGRIWLLWNNDLMTVQSSSITDQCLTCFVQLKNGKLSCLMSMVYASNQRENRKRLWQDLLEIKQNVNCPWLVGGDFNAIISAEEKMGGAPISDADTEDFQNFISSSQLLHIKSIGCFYTWNNKQDTNTRVWSRIDRILINDKWLHHYTTSQVEFLVLMCSDHSPALVSVGEEDFQGKKPFKFYKMWTKHPNFFALVNSVWGQEIKGYNMYQFYSKLKKLKPVLKELNKKHFMNIGEQVARAKEELLGVQNQMSLDLLNQNLITQEKKCIQKYNRLLQCEESFHRQKANISWAVHGDRSSQYFHSIMKAKSKYQLGCAWG
ncbi:uncharacterized protein LOC109847689 [Asparagus officinalis]|uniref:uncharacterized protein LOC109847689 n=1 Tax=Asparagus officinalis TaxID=4686 RepID=UPI00098E6904|nr:uncharacterized protein LOC109847689 [Asparagus officinalis]